MFLAEADAKSEGKAGVDWRKGVRREPGTWPLKKLSGVVSADRRLSRMACHDIGKKHRPLLPRRRARRNRYIFLHFALILFLDISIL